MSDPWIKARVHLKSDPKVIRIAERLSADKTFRAWLGLSKECADQWLDSPSAAAVVEGLVVSALLVIWGVVRRDGVRPRTSADAAGHAQDAARRGAADGAGADEESEDLVLHDTTLRSLDRLSGVPGFGAAMESVGWAVPGDGDTVTFPKLLPHITSPEERRRQKDAARKRAKRAELKRLRELAAEAQADASTDGPRTRPDLVPPMSALDKTREEKNTTPPTPQGVGEEAEVVVETEEPQEVKKVFGDTLEEIRARGSQRDQKIQTPPVPAAPPTPAQPQPATQTRRETISDHPHLKPAADRVLKHYREVCAPCPPGRPSACGLVASLLAKGHSEAKLKASADAYANVCRNTDTKRQAPHTFFSAEGSWSVYADGEHAVLPPPKAPPPKVEALA